MLYTEMITTRSLLYGDRKNLLDFSAREHLLAIQLGGGDPYELAECARMAADWGYDEVNLNVGCPSDRAQESNSGVWLMTQPALVARCVEAMRRAVDLPVTVKHRIGVDTRDRYEDLVHFVQIVAGAGCDRFIVHARKALQGFNTRQNRTLPPLRYAEVYRLRTECPTLIVEINGGIKTLNQAVYHLTYVDGVMIGRAAYDNPFLFASVDSLFFGDPSPPPTRRTVVEAMILYIDQWKEKGLPPTAIVRHLLGLFTGQRGTKAWKRYLSENIQRVRTDPAALLDALNYVPEEVLDEIPSVPLLTPFLSRSVS